MLPAIHRSLAHLLYERGNIDPREVDISFEVPTRERVERQTQPTIYLFLYDVRENLALRQSDMETTRANGRAIHRMLSRRFDLHYMVCAPLTSIDDEHLLLWRALTTLVRHPQIPDELLDEELRELEPPLSGRMYHEDDAQKQFSIWSGLEVPPHPVFYYAVTAPIDLNPSGEAPLVLSRATRYSGFQTISGISDTRRQIGGVVRDTEGTPLTGVTVALEGSALEYTTGDDGQFLLRNVPAGSIQLRVARLGQEPQRFAIVVPDGTNGATNGQLLFNVVLASGHQPEKASSHQ